MKSILVHILVCVAVACVTLSPERAAAQSDPAEPPPGAALPDSFQRGLSFDEPGSTDLYGDAAASWDGDAAAVALARAAPDMPSGWLTPTVSPAAFRQGSAPAEDAAELPAGDKNPWRFTFESQWWLPTVISGPMTVGPTVTDLNIYLGTIFEDLKFVFEGGFTLTNDQWSLLVWGLYMNLGTDVVTNVRPLGDFDTRLNLAAVIVNVMGAYRIADWQLGNSETATWGLDVTAGVMIWDMDMQLNEQVPGSGFGPGIEEHDTWVDAMVGGRLRFKFNDKLSASLRGEVGGFGIGNSADLDWNVTLVGEYRLNNHIGLVLGYRYLEIDWSEGSGVSAVGYDWTIKGVILGVNIHF